MTLFFMPYLCSIWGMETNNEKQEALQPLDIASELMELVRPSGLEITGFTFDGNRINLEVGSPYTHNPPSSLFWMRLLEKKGLRAKRSPQS